MKTRIHVNQHNIRANAKGADVPVLTVKDYKENRKVNTAQIVSCGAKVWIETELEVKV